MSIRNAWPYWLLGSLLLTVLLFIASCFGLYWLGARHLPERLSPTSTPSSSALRQQFIVVEADGVRHVPEYNPVSFWWSLGRSFLSHSRSANPAEPEGWRLLVGAARIVNIRPSTTHSNFTRHLVEAAAMVKISRQWTFEQTVDTLLAGSHYGRDSVGIEAAAHAYFGVSAKDLAPDESLALIALMKGPSWYSPDCRRERFANRYRYTAQRLGDSATTWAPETALRRLRAYRPCSTASASAPASVITPKIDVTQI